MCYLYESVAFIAVFLFRAVEVPKPRVSEWNYLFLTHGSGTSSGRNENRRPLLNTNIPLIRKYGGKCGLRTTFDHWIVFSWGTMRKNRFSQNSRFWGLGFLIYTLSCANLKKIPPWKIQWVSLHVPATSVWALYTLRLCAPTVCTPNCQVIEFSNLKYLLFSRNGAIPPSPLIEKSSCPKTVSGNGG